ncbi:RecQ family ATP-dependent DNA helicase [bacterium]|nr:RecQ family ATP-dependent DNA helicase [bacterium]MDB4657539.1 RecQ family ATP-dependent DNA helicase [Verrucomicrobiales bacterium]MDC0275784.1 RecQ family ATP-dependent DNA helicase [Verrucomicrobiales bacterium]
MSDSPLKILKSTFGHESFRPGQLEVIEILMAGRSALAVFPTGGGKSLCFQLPALLLDGLTLVISPLIALMKDQVESLQRVEVAAARLDSSLSSEEVAEIYNQLEKNELKLLYVAPERMANEGFLRRLKVAKISLLAIDEAHCISEWGHNFRPDYLKIASLSEELKIPRVLGLTATATANVSADIRASFDIPPEDHIQTGYRRENLSFHATPCRSEDRVALLIERLKSRPPGPGIVYVTLQRTAEVIAGELKAAGFNARAYHAGMKDEHRAEVQDGFMDDEIDLVVATIAFGMGIDKANITYVYHFNLPKSLENYIQESGRAGRDGNEAICEILACADDRIVLENFVFGDTPAESAIRSLVEHMLLQGDSFSISRYDLSATKDIRPLVVATALTYLELEGILIPKGPFYGAFRVKIISTMPQIMAGYDADRQALLQQIFEAGKKGWYSTTIFDIEEVSLKIQQPEDRIRQAIQYLEEMGDITAKPSKLRHAYKIAPGASRDVSALTKKLMALFDKREQSEVIRIENVIEICESGTCLTRQFVNYFGESMAEECGTCGNCQAPSKTRLPLSCSITGELSTDQVEMIHELHGEKHASLRRPRQLARFLCGIASPAAIRERLTWKDDRFGSLGEIPFQIVLAQAEALVTF